MNISFIMGHNDKIAFVGGKRAGKTTLFSILMGEMEPMKEAIMGVTTSQAYFPKDSTKEFDNDLTIADWLMGYSPVKDITYVRGFLGRMLFAGEDGVKKVRVLSGGEKVRCLLSKMMISGANCLVLDEPTNHLDMESITALNNGLIKFPGVALFSCRDHQFVADHGKPHHGDPAGRKADRQDHHLRRISGKRRDGEKAYHLHRE